MTKREEKVLDLAEAMKAIRLRYNVKNPALYAAANSKGTRAVVLASMEKYGLWIGVQPDDPAQQRWLYNKLLQACGLKA